MLCYRCGSHVPDGSETCGACGQKFASGSLKQTTGTFSRKKLGGTRLEGAPFADGEVLGERYVIKHGIGSGPLGFVFKAHDKEIDVEVALKVISPRLLQTSEERRAFAREVRQARKLSHNNIVRVYEDGEEKDHPFFTMQYLDGLTLRRIIDLRREKNQTFALAEVEPILAQIASGLDSAHKLGPHGDVKPENVIVLPDLLKLTDFGIAMGIPRQPFGAAQRTRNAHRYLAPEYLNNHDVDRRADIYSLGVMLGEMVAGVFPDGASTLELRSRNPDLPGAIDGLYRKAINENPLMRHASAGEFMAELALINASAEKAKPPPLKRAPPPKPPPPVPLEEEPVRAEPARKAPPPVEPPRRRGDTPAKPPPPPPPVAAESSRPARNGKPPSATQTLPVGDLAPRARQNAAPGEKKSSTWILALAAVGVLAGAGAGYAYLTLSKTAGTTAPDTKLVVQQPKQTPTEPAQAAADAGPAVGSVEPGKDIDLAADKADAERKAREAAALAEAEKKKAEEERARLEEERKRKEALEKAFEAKTNDRKTVQPAVAVAPARPTCPGGMRLIPAGSFKMGSSRDDPMTGFDERPLASVSVDAYCIDVYEYPNRNGATPVTGVSFAAAESMCKTRGKRLCTEEEWEKACKGSSNARFPYGNSFNADACNTEDADGEDREVGAAGAFKSCRSGYGVFDMSGNVAEWTASVYKSGVPDRAFKGGSADRPDYDTRCASRKNGGPGTKKEQLGFRCCADVGQ